MEANDLFNCTEANFLYQHIDIPTREASILDLVITNEPNMIKDPAKMGMLEGCDHSMLEFKLDGNISTSVRSVFGPPML